MIHLILIALFLIVLPAFLLSFLTRKPIELYIAVMLPFYSVWLYLCGVINCLRLGLHLITVFVVILIVLGILYSIRQFKRKKTKEKIIEPLKDCLSPGLVIFSIGIIFASYMAYGRIYSGNDDFSHWGRIVKLLFAYNQLPVKNEEILSLVMFKSYPLGMSLVGYLFAKFYSNTFYDYAHFFSSDIFILSQFIIFISGTKWKKAFLGIMCQLCMFLVCLILLPNFFTSVYVDAVLGIMLASCIYSSVIMSSFSWKQSIYISIMLSCLILIKQSGVGLAVLVLIAPTIIGFGKTIQAIKRRSFRDIYKTIPPYFVPYLALLINWIHKKTLSGTRINFSGEKITFKNIYDGWYYNSNGVFTEIFNKMIDQVFFVKKNYFVIPTSYFALILLCSITIYFLIKDEKKKNKVVLFLPFLMIFGFLIYSITLFFYYNFSFSSYEGPRLASFDRYIATYLIFSFLVVCAMLYQLSTKIDYTAYSKTTFFFFLASALLLLPQFGTIKTFFNPITNQSTAEFSSVFDQIIHQNISIDDKFFLVSQTSKGFEGLVPAVYFPLNYYPQTISWGEPQYDGDIWSAQKTNKQIEDLLAKCQFCYIHKTNNYFSEHYSQYFDNLIDKPNVLYKVVDGKLHPVTLKRFVFDFKKASLFDVTELVKSSIDYSARKGFFLARMMEKGKIELRPKSFCPLWNGRLNKISLLLDNISGETSITIKVNGVIALESELNESSGCKLSINLPDIEVNDLRISFEGRSEYSSLIIKEVVLDYSEPSNNNQNLYSVSPFSIQSNSLRHVVSSNSFRVQGKQNVLKSLTPFRNPIPEDGGLVFSGKISNEGNTSPTIYIGWSPFSQELKEIRPIHVQPVDSTYTTLASDLSPESTIMIVQDASKWVVDKETSVFFEAETDFSDIPNFSPSKYGDIKVVSISKQPNNTWKITLDKPVKFSIKNGTGVRLHKTGGIYLYSQVFKLSPGEEKVFEGTINGFSSQNNYKIKDGWPKGSKFASIVILSYSGKDDDVVFRDLNLRAMAFPHEEKDRVERTETDAQANAETSQPVPIAVPILTPERI